MTKKELIEAVRNANEDMNCICHVPIQNTLLVNADTIPANDLELCKSLFNCIIMPSDTYDKVLSMKAVDVIDFIKEAFTPSKDLISIEITF